MNVSKGTSWPFPWFKDYRWYNFGCGVVSKGILTITCTRRNLGGYVFGQEFDSPHLHQQGRAPAPNSALLYVRRFFYCRSSILSKTQPLFRRGGHFPSSFFVNTQSHRCDNLCVTFTNSGAYPCTRSALLYVRRFFIAAHGSLFINPTLLFHHGRRWYKKRVHYHLR